MCRKHTQIQIKLVLKSKSCEYEFQLFKAFNAFTNAATKRLLENYIELKDVCSIYESVNGNFFSKSRDFFQRVSQENVALKI